MWQLGPDANAPEWELVETDFNTSLYEVVQTVDGPYAVGSGGTLVANRDGKWEIVLDDGPGTRNNQLRAMDVTDDGERVWFLGSSGALGCYDVETQKKYDYSYPNEMTSTWEGIAAAGDRGKEKLIAANGSGEVLPFTIDGFDVNWGVPSKPEGMASKIAALTSSPDGVGYAIDTSGNAFKTTKDDGWKDIGVVNAQVKFYDVYAGSNSRVYIAAGDGRIYRYDDSYHDWTPIGVTDEVSLRAFDIYETDEGAEMVVVGNAGGIFQRDSEERWQQLHSPTKKSLLDLALGSPDIAIGTGGVVLKRRRGEPKHAGKSKDGDNFDGRGERFDGGEGAEGETVEKAKEDTTTDEGNDPDTDVEDPDDAPDTKKTEDPDTDPDDAPDVDSDEDPDTDPDDAPDVDSDEDPDTDPDDAPDEDSDDAPDEDSDDAPDEDSDDAPDEDSE